MNGRVGRCRLRLPVPATAPVPGAPPAWRLTTAVRIFALALLMGQVFEDGLAGRLGILLIGLAIIGAACCISELNTAGRTPWLSVAEGVMVGLLVGMTDTGSDALHLYLMVPAIAAGVASGRLATTNTWLVTTLSWLAAEAATVGSDAIAGRVDGAAPWLVIGLGAALLAAQQSGSLRTVAAAHAPYAAAHRLAGELHTLARSFPTVLDVTTQTSAIRRAVNRAIGAESCVVLASEGEKVDVAPGGGTPRPDEAEAGRLCALYGRPILHTGFSALPLRAGQHVLGAVVVRSTAPLTQGQVETVQRILDEQAIRLQTALLVEDVRFVATAEERNRLARDIHDGMAQRIVALGYLADEVTVTSNDPIAVEAAEALRTEISKLLSELRFSVFDLREPTDTAVGLSAALSEYVRELSAHSRLRVHLTLDQQDDNLPRRTEYELLRIAKEAIANAHKHAQALNVWVELRTVGGVVRLDVEDDGIGGATVKAGHYGMHTMSERAESIDAELTIGTRPGGGTTVTVRSRNFGCTQNGAEDDQRLARR